MLPLTPTAHPLVMLVAPTAMSVLPQTLTLAPPVLLATTCTMEPALRLVLLALTCHLELPLVWLVIPPAQLVLGLPRHV